MRSKFVALSMLFMFILVSCARVPITNRKQVKLLPENLVMSMAFTNYQDFIKTNPPVPAGDANVELVRKTGNRISQAVKEFLAEKNQSKRVSGFKWEYNLVNNSAVNAWCMPGGKIVFYTGILPYTQDEYGIATVMGHEVAHAVANHGNERLSQQLAIALGGVSLAIAMKDKPELTQNIFLMVYGVGSTLGVLAYSRLHEYEADKLGMVFMARAGYDPERAIDFWERMAKKSTGPKPPQFLSTHPSDENRIEKMKQFLPEAKKYYKPR